jgi:hypothetical protein
VSLAYADQMSYSGGSFINVPIFLDCEPACVQSLKAVNIEPISLRHDVVRENVGGLGVGVLLPETCAESVLSVIDRADGKVLARDPTLVADLDVGRPRRNSPGCRARRVPPWGGCQQRRKRQRVFSPRDMVS